MIETTILEDIQKYAAETYTDEKEAADFVNGFVEKVATFPPQSIMDGVKKGLGEQGGRSLAGAGTAVAISGIAKFVDSVKAHNLYNEFLKALNQAVQHNRVLKGSDKDRVVSFAHTIFKFAPHVATDVNMLSSILANAVHGEGVDPMTIKTLTELESRYRDTRSFRPKDFV